ncbi:MAG TPA: hypothetical protein VFN23_03980, partial [Ktedonobacteraceae bacterium]|nr:hypothetical protein [Ktedonobacteraceae bacterium]
MKQENDRPAQMNTRRHARKARTTRRLSPIPEEELAHQSTMRFSEPDKKPARNLPASFIRWFRDNTFYPTWQPRSLRNPIFGYLMAIVLQVIAILVTQGILYIFPDYPFPGLLLILGIVLAALNWGAGSSLISTIISL